MRRLDLVADCASCAAMCCTATSFEASEEFACAKSAGVRCGNLTRGGRCAIHGELAARGFAGCAIYDCYGAGPRATRAFAGRLAGEGGDRGGGRAGGRGQVEGDRDAAFLVLRVVHELMWLLDEAARLCPVSSELAGDLAAQLATLEAIADGPVAALIALDVAAHEAAARAVLRRVGSALGGRKVFRIPLAVR
jgi:hypothetical protein